MPLSYRRLLAIQANDFEEMRLVISTSLYNENEKCKKRKYKVVAKENL